MITNADGELVAEVYISGEEQDYIQYLMYDLNAYKDILAEILLQKTKYSCNFNYENYRHFMDEYKEANIKLNASILTLVEKYAPEYYGNIRYQAYFNFDKRNIMEIRTVENTDNKGCGGCSHGKCE